jgi:internalin A
MFYDFGGQDFYHGLYQSFSSKTAFQIVVYCADQTEIELKKDSKGYKTYKYPLSFWLKEKEYLERGTHNPYFIVENKIDDKATNSFAKDFPHIVDFENPKGIFHLFLKELATEDHSKELQNQLQLEYLKKQLLQELYEEKEISKSLTVFFQDIYDDSTKPKLTIKQRTQYVVDGISPENMLTQLRLLENSGVLFLSEDTEQVITNPQAFIQYIHTKVLEQKALFKVCGRLKKQEWKELNNGEYAKLIEDFMIKQKTMFYDEDAEEYVFPNYLSLYSEDEERHFLTVSESLLAFSIQLKYFLPFGFINVLIHHFGQEPNKKKFWRDAIYFIKHVNDQPKANVFINLNIKQLCIDVYVETRDSEFDVQSYKRYLWLCLATMYEQGKLISWEAFLELKKAPKHDKEELKLHEGKPLFLQSKFPKTAKVSTDGKFYTTLSNLEERIKKNEYDIYLDNQEGRSSRLPLYKFQVFTEKPINKMKKIFISYSNEDIHYKKELEKFLKPLKEFQLAQSWSCEELNAELWHDKIQEELESSDIVIFMMSMNFASSEYILKEEVHKTFEHLKTNQNKKIICVLVRQFPWKVFSEYKDVLGEVIFKEDENKAAIALTKLPEHQFLPYDIEKGDKKEEANRVLKPLNQWEFQEEAYTQIIKVLSKIL